MVVMISIQISCMSEVLQQIMASGAVDKQKEDSNLLILKPLLTRH